MPSAYVVRTAHALCMLITLPQTSPKTPVVEKSRASLGQFKLFGHIRFGKSSRPNFDLFDVSIEKFTA